MHSLSMKNKEINILGAILDYNVHREKIKHSKIYLGILSGKRLHIL